MILSFRINIERDIIPMKIELLDKIFKENIFTYRTCKIRYSYAFENCLKMCIRDRKNNDTIMEKEVIDFLADYLFQQYYDGILTKPSKTTVRRFFENFFRFEMCIRDRA